MLGSQAVVEQYLDKIEPSCSAIQAYTPPEVRVVNIVMARALR